MPNKTKCTKTFAIHQEKMKKKKSVTYDAVSDNYSDLGSSGNNINSKKVTKDSNVVKKTPSNSISKNTVSDAQSSVGQYKGTECFIEQFWC